MSSFVSPFEKTKRAFTLGNVSVMLGIPVNRNFHPNVTKCLIKTCVELSERGIPFEVNMEIGCSIPHHARSLVADNFLRSQYTKLFWIDSDIIWSVEDFIRLLCLSTVFDAVGGIYPAKCEPTVFLMRPAHEVQALDEYGCLEIRGMGLGFTVVSREAMERLAADAPKVKFTTREHLVAHMFRCDVQKDEDGQNVPRGEDMAFFDDIRALGYRVHLDPSVALKHMGDKAYGGKFMDAMQRIA